MGDVVNFSKKKLIMPENEPGEDLESVSIMMCGHCNSPGFFLGMDGRLFCVNCKGPVAAAWHIVEIDPVA